VKPYFNDGVVTLHLGNCRNVLTTLPDASVDAVCTDPPYEIGFMGRAWDATGIAYDTDMWAQCWRVLKPGGHLLAFGATRTYHRLAVAIEDAGFEIRDSIHWIYGNGFPKGQDVGKSIDRKRDDRGDVLRVTAFLRQARINAGIGVKAIDEKFGFNGMASHWTAVAGKAATAPTLDQWARLQQLLGFDSPEMDDIVAELNARKGEIGEAWAQREVVGHRHSGLSNGGSSVFLSGVTGRYENNMVPVTGAATDAAKQWQGWNTSLKPAHEPIVVARKSTGFNTTVANVLQHGTGAINVDACRIEVTDTDYARNAAGDRGHANNRTRQAEFRQTAGSANGLGRWPANVVFAHSPDCTEQCTDGCPIADLDGQTGTLTSGAMAAGTPRTNRSGYAGAMSATTGAATHGDSGGASRYFPAFRYEAKASASERPRLDDGTMHNTVKPLDLMRWLVRLVTPPGGTVLDPFVGSGTTLEACVIEGFHGIGIEQHQPYAELCVKRLSKPIQAVLGFEEAS
jgi:hypothetical protein